MTKQTPEKLNQIETTFQRHYLNNEQQAASDGSIRTWWLMPSRVNMTLRHLQSEVWGDVYRQTNLYPYTAFRG